MKTKTKRSYSKPKITKVRVALRQENGENDGMSKMITVYGEELPELLEKVKEAVGA